jgi:hypothetical protein
MIKYYNTLVLEANENVRESSSLSIRNFKFFA